MTILLLIPGVTELIITAFSVFSTKHIDPCAITSPGIKTMQFSDKLQFKIVRHLSFCCVLCLYMPETAPFRFPSLTGWILIVAEGLRGTETCTPYAVLAGI